MSKSTSSTGGSSIVMGMLGVLFVGLKLTGHIDWSWWWVTAPFWGGIALLLVVMMGVGVVAGIYTLIKRRR